jgi:hypothetical protein
MPRIAIRPPATQQEGWCLVRTLKEMVRDEQAVRFRYYRDKELWYATECGFEFPVPIDDTGTGIFMAEDRAILFMRWIRRHLALIEASRQQQDGLESPAGPA